jgi:hypothetical protein
MTTAEIVHLRQQEQAKFQCSACGADRGCDCNAPAVEKLRELREATRQRVAAHRERKAEQKQRSRNVTKDDETPFEGIECEGDDEETCWRRGLLYRATNAADEAAYEDWTRFRVDAELVSAAERAATAWKETAAYLRGLYRANT